MTSSAIDAQATCELSAGELEQVAGGGVWTTGPGRNYEPPPPLRVENAPQMGGGGNKLNLPHLHAF
ncbi:hypothetical protein [Bradyrhizobium sp. Bra64]|uniref:hypothetical protein n=1 Tax=Bradyrhizobium sp. Bra64 TaxID=2926009 RepID=UPI0021182751|nr:hypothetical protein [Bradyrhizobium sp. Bra64]